MTSAKKKKSSVRIGCAAGFWGDTETAAPQLLMKGRLDYLVFDYLAEMTMSIMAAARRKNEGGYATDFVTRVMRACMRTALEQGVRIVANAGGVNPLACRDALVELAKTLGVSPKIAVVLGDDILSLHEALAREGTKEMYSGTPLPPHVLSSNAYLGAKPIVDALATGADIVITGRIVDSALALGPLAHEFGWSFSDFDLLASGSLAGHLVECGAQCTGGLFTDWMDVPGYDDMGYPIIECASDGSFTVEKPEGTGGLVNKAVVYEQMVYEIGDPRSYVLPDVVCDFGEVVAESVGNDRVRVWGAKGRPPTAQYKVSATFADGHRVDVGMLLAGDDARRKGMRVGKALVDKIERLLVARGFGPFSAAQIDALGSETLYGDNARAQATREVVVRIAAAHEQADALKLMLRELPQAGTSMAPGLCSFIGGRPSPTPVVKLFSFLIDKTRVEVEIDVAGERAPVDMPSTSARESGVSAGAQDTVYPPVESHTRVPLLALAHGRSGDKGNHSNIGILAREKRFVPFIGAALTADAVARHLVHLLDPNSGRVIRYEWPGCDGFNFVLFNSLGGGGMASLRADPQGKTYAQQLLAFLVPIPKNVYEELRIPRM